MFLDNKGIEMMLRVATKRLLAVGLVSLAFCLGCEPSKTVVPVIKISPSAVAAKAMTLYDTNKDGKINGAELDKAPCLLFALDMFETDAAKGVTAEQITARIQKWNDDKNGLVPVMCNVTRNGAPVADAEIKFVPDACISDYLTQTAVGKTNKNGMARVNLPKEPGSEIPPGVPPGFYRVEITKAGETIPAQYNTATTLGVEISADGAYKHALVGKKMVFEMKY